jgi:hypothetical protein
MMCRTTSLRLPGSPHPRSDAELLLRFCDLLLEYHIEVEQAVLAGARHRLFECVRRSVRWRKLTGRAGGMYNNW